MTTETQAIGVGVETETLSDGSKAFNLFIGKQSFHCLSEKHADEAAVLIGKILQNTTSEAIFIV